MLRFALLVGATLATLLMLASVAGAGVTNPNISILGQPFARWTDAEGDPASRRVGLDPGETEIVFDDYLNPYARGFFTVALGEEGAEVEEGFFTLLRGLPADLVLKGGKYRVGFGRLNPVHAHAYPFSERFGVLSAYLPGEEAFNETGLQLSERLPVPGNWAITASADWLHGHSFRIPRESSGDPSDPIETGEGDREDEPRPGVLGRLVAFAPLGERSGLELGLSAVQGTNNVAAGSRTTVIGADAKLKVWTSANAYLVVQGEVLSLDREDAAWDPAAAAYTTSSVKPTGGYLYADYDFNLRYNVGASYERFQQPTSDETTDQAFGLFAGLALLEESTAFRIDWKHFMPGTSPAAADDPPAVNTVTLRVIYSMGPHKAHQF
ncbi:MAG TPA: hypothetical protein VEY91_11145 [Candidatus Limnocylindria bacterium]|nr:hypothetical protein [Candidatus Limnocylindria bacterium]